MNFSRWIQPLTDTATASGSPDPDPSNQGQVLALAGLILCLSLLLGTLLSGYSPFRIPDYQVGDIARADVTIPVDTLIEDEEATRDKRAAARAAALPVYRFDATLESVQGEKVRAAFRQARALLELPATGERRVARSRTPSLAALSPDRRARLKAILQGLGPPAPGNALLAFLVREGFHPALEERLIALLRSGYATMCLPENSKPLGREASFHRLNLGADRVETVSAAQMASVTEVRERLKGEIRRDPSLAGADRPHWQRLVEMLLVPNLIPDERLSRERREFDVQNVDPVLRQLKKGRIVLRQGDEVRPEHLRQIDTVRRLSPVASSLRQAVGMGALVMLLLACYVHLLRIVPLGQWRHARLAWFSLLTLAVNLALIKLSWFVCDSVSQNLLAAPFNDRQYLFYLLPFAWGAMLVTLLAGERCGQLFILLQVLLAGQAAGSDLNGLFYILVVNLTGMVAIRQAKQRIALVGAGFRLGLAAAAVALLLLASRQAPLGWVNGGYAAAMAFVSGPLNVTLLMFMLPVSERLFRVTTEIRLSELGNLNLPLVREMMLKAPGTYSHSIAVGTLCEGAAKAIGLNPLFLRIASLYHDVGKTRRAEYFTENQHGDNPHDRISPQDSAQILKSHVTEGVRIAEKAHLPPSLIDLIPQHHGTRLIPYFFDKAKGQGDTSVEEGAFRYGGPKPKSKEAAILMLADGIEAAARTLENHSRENLKEVIRRINVALTEDGQFSECTLTMAEMNRITYVFLETLSSHYHNRVAYPGFDFNAGPATVGRGTLRQERRDAT